MLELPFCDVCLEPAGPTVTGLGLPGVVTCLECCVFARNAGLGLADAADFLELCRTVDSNSCLKSELETDGEMSPAWLESHGITMAPPPRSLFAPAAEDGPPAVAGAILPPPPAPDPSEPADPEANVLRVFQWPPHCGQWFVRVGSPNDRRSIQYGPLRSPTEVLEQFVGHLAARKYRFDGGYTPPAE